MWISRKNYNKAIDLYEQWMAEDDAEITALSERVEYLENEREANRIASLTPKGEPITVLVNNEHAEAIAEHDKAVADHDDALAEHDKAVAEHDRLIREYDEDISRWENEGGA